MQLFVVVLALAGYAAAQSDDPYSKRIKQCRKDFSYRVLRSNQNADALFKHYGNTTASSEDDCIRKCFENTDFCAAAMYLSRERTCMFSYKYILCDQGTPAEEVRNRRSQSSPSIMHCVKCTETEQMDTKTNPTKIRKASTARRPATQNRRRPTAQSSRRQQTTQSRRQQTSQSRIQTERTTQQTTRRRTAATLTDRRQSQSQSQTPHRLTFAPSTQAPRTAAPVAQTRAPAAAAARSAGRRAQQLQRPEVVPLVQDRLDLLNNHSKSLDQRCTDALRKPCDQGFGRQCKLVDNGQGCEVCACPYKSPARGCAGPQGLDESTMNDLLMLRQHCPDEEEPMQIVHRYYRRKSAGFDDCVLTKVPYCGWLQDVNVWRMPRSYEDCQYFCYSDAELDQRGVNFSL